MDLHYQYYTDLQTYLTRIRGEYHRAYQYKKKGGYHVYDIPCAFDIETSSFIQNEHKQAICYIWQFAFNGYVFIGRNLEDFPKFLDVIIKEFEIDESNRLYIYVHNLSYEFQFIRYYFNWSDVFAVDSRKPIKCVLPTGIEFRDSYILSGYSLAKVAENLQEYNVKKLVGDLVYSKIRTPKTFLSGKEIQYCINDVLVVSAYIQEQINQYKCITRIPLTNTGRVRNYCKKNCFSKENKLQYKKLMRSLTLEVEEYQLLKRCFMGGFTHANAEKVGRVIENVSSYDFTSSYPYVMVSEKFPMGKGFKVNIKDFNHYKKLAKNFCLVFDMVLENVTPKLTQDNPLSVSKCWKIEGAVENNGRVVSADLIYTSGTEIDLEIYQKFYSIGHCTITNVYAYQKDYLPRPFLLSILQLYKDKTELKGVEGKEVEYLHSKGMINSCYGMTVTNIAKDRNTYNETGWVLEPVDLDEEIEKYNGNPDRFLFYPWGIYVTAYARRNLFTAIASCGHDYCYSDTDSVKIENRENHLEYFKKYNEVVEMKLRESATANNIPYEYFAPKTIKGITKVIGVFDYEGDYQYFKTLGAKRYLYYDGKLHVTIAGVNKHTTENYFNQKYDTVLDVFKAFNNSLIIPSEHTGKLTSTYIDFPMDGIVTDYYGNEYEYHAKSGIHLGATSFEISMSALFLKYLMGVTYEFRL